IVIVNDLGNYDISTYSFKLGRKWGIGQEKTRNGIVIVVKPKTSTSRGQAFIATGKGLEGAIPDATGLQIVDNEMIPYFKEGNYYQGLNAATDVLMSLAKGEFNYTTYSSKNDFNYSFLFILIPVIILILISVFRNRNRFNNGGYTMGNSGWFPFIGGGGFGNNDSSGSSSSSSGFGGFGGGDFGGGGAGGSW
ncbi:MAG: TPM domain-containing protein, partial [Bacteroidia bacterium]